MSINKQTGKETNKHGHLKLNYHKKCLGGYFKCKYQFKCIYQTIYPTYP